MQEKYFISYDEVTGEIKGFYVKSVHGDNIPTPNKEITSEKHDFYMVNNGLYKLNPLTLEDELLPTPEPLPYVKSPLEINTERIGAMEDAFNLFVTMI